jgi:hypothetical protein
MFRRITALVCALALAGALSWTAQAAPVTGSFGLELVFFPANGGDFKIDFVAVKFEADLVLSISISGLDLTSTRSLRSKAWRSSSSRPRPPSGP